MKKLALFDFDGTITTKDTFVEFIKHNKGTFKFWVGFLLLSPLIIGFKLKLFPNWRAKELVITYFFKGTPLPEFKAMCTAFYKNRLGELIRPQALEEIAKFLQEGTTVSLVSASPELWIEDWAKEVGIELIGTKLEIKDNKITGKIAGKNCYGLEKEVRVKAVYNLSEFEQIFAYGDSSGDTELLALAHEKFYKPFRS